MSKTQVHGYSSESAQRELSNEYQYDRFQMLFSIFFCFCALDKSSLSIGRVNSRQNIYNQLHIDTISEILIPA